MTNLEKSVILYVFYLSYMYIKCIYITVHRFLLLKY